MKKVLLVVALLLLATPVFAADVEVTATSGALNTAEANVLIPVTIGYKGAASTDAIGAFALVLTTDSGCNIDHIRDYNRGESKVVGGGYGIFPGKFRDLVNPSNPDPCYALAAYNPIAPSGDLNGTGGNDNPRMVVELGTLYVDANKPGASGSLFTVDVNFEGAIECNLCVAVEMTRGGVVKKDANQASVTLPPGGDGALAGCLKVRSVIPTVTISGKVFGANPPKTAGIEGIRLVGTTGFPTDINTNVTGDYVATVNSGWSGTVTPTDFNNQWTWLPANRTYTSITANQTAQDFNGTATECLNAKDPGYAAWISATWNKPNCWCFKRQCRGDSGGTKVGFWVYTSDLNLLKSTYGKSDAVVAGIANGICSDLDHLKVGFRVYTGDLNIIKTYYGKADAIVPECNLAPVITKYNRWTN